MKEKSKKVLFIINPKSGKGLIRNHLLEVIDIFTKSGMKVTTYTTQKELDACEVVMEQAADYDMIICCGGDGTLDEVITGMMKGNCRLPVGYIPAGSTNDFARSLKLPRNMKDAARCITKDHLYACDIGAFNSDYFVYIAAFGAFTEVSYQTRQEVKNVLGHLAYVLEGTKHLFNLKSYKLKIKSEQQEMEDEFIYGMITNSESVGGFKNITGNKVKLDDGVFEVTLIRTPQNPMELQEIMGAILRKEVDNRHFYSFKTNHLEIVAEEEIPWTLDGEFGGNHKIVHITNHQRAISIMVRNIGKQ